MSTRTRSLSLEQFQKDIATHQVEVVLSQGVHRHLRVRRPRTYCMGFDIVTYPGHICYSGDMGCYVFARLPDMFEFFRSGITSTGLRISADYWAEKLQSVDHDGVMEYEPALFIEAVRSRLDEAVEIGSLTAEVATEIKRDLGRSAHDSEYEARLAARDCDAYEFDFGAKELRAYTYRFLWCCYAIVWTIQKFDALPARAEAA